MSKPGPKRQPDPRIEQAWQRVAVARRVFGVAAVVGFGAAMALARTTYAGHPKHRPRSLSAPTGRTLRMKNGLIAR